MLDHHTISRAMLADMLDELLDEGFVVIISKDAEDEYLANAGNGTDQRRFAASTLEGVVEGLTDHPRAKTCVRKDCVSRGRPKPLSEFGPDRDAADGHSAVCKRCEAKRIGELTRKRKAT